MAKIKTTKLAEIHRVEKEKFDFGKFCGEVLCGFFGIVILVLLLSSLAAVGR